MSRFLVFAWLCIFSFQVSGQQKTYVKHPDWSKNATIYEANIRQFSPEGTFKAFEKHIPVLKEMGVKIIWLMPINPIGEKNRKGSLGSYYSVKDYKGINPEFGNEQDFRELIKTIHDAGMFVIVDWVANHAAWDHPWTVSHPEYFTKNANGEFIPPVDDWTDVIDLNYDNPGLREAMLDALKYWVKEFNIDGYRCDVASMVPTDFWDHVRSELDKIKPVFMLAESASPDLHVKAFDMTYGWQFKDLFNEIAKGKKSAADIDHYLTTDENKNYHPEAYRMIFTTNHDENSWDDTEFNRLGESVNTMAVLSVMLRGMPLIYTGQEFGSNKKFKFFDKDLVEHNQQKGQKELYTTLLNLKLKTPALWNGIDGGDLVRLKTNNDKEIFAFIRRAEGSKVVCFFNLSDKNQMLSVNTELLGGSFYELGSSLKVQCSDNYKADLKPWQYVVWIGADN